MANNRVLSQVDKQKLSTLINIAGRAAMIRAHAADIVIAVTEMREVIVHEKGREDDSMLLIRRLEQAIGEAFELLDDDISSMGV